MGISARDRLNGRSLRWLLQRCVAEHDWGSPLAELESSISGRDLTSFVSSARYQRVSSAAYLSIRGLPGVDPRVEEELRQEYLRGATQHLLAEHTLAETGHVLDSAGLPWMVFKGPIAANMYARPDLRAYSDLDILVPPDAFVDAVSALELGGAVLLDSNWPLITDEMRGQLHLHLPGGMVCDLHWDLLNREEVRRGFRIPTAELFASRTKAEVLGSQVTTLSPPNTIVHLCLHAALSGGDRLGWLKDIDRAVHALEPSWSEVVGVATDWRARLATGTMLRRSASALGTPVPADVLRQLSHGLARRAVAALDTVSHPGAATGPYNVTSLSSPTLRDRGLGWSPQLRRWRPTRHLVARCIAWCSWRSHEPDLARLVPVMVPHGGADDRTQFMRKVRSRNPGRTCSRRSEK